MSSPKTSRGGKYANGPAMKPFSRSEQSYIKKAAEYIADASELGNPLGSLITEKESLRNAFQIRAANAGHPYTADQIDNAMNEIINKRSKTAQAMNNTGYDWQPEKGMKLNVTDGLSKRTETGDGFKVKLKNGGYAKIVQNPRGELFVRVGQYQVDPPSNTVFARGRSFKNVPDAMNAIERFFRQHPRLKPTMK